MRINQSEQILAAARSGNVDPRVAIIVDFRVRYERLKAKYPRLVRVESGEMTSFKNIVFQGLTRE